jgi:hypothetical protein
VDIVETNYCSWTLENIDAVRKFWSALANLLRSRTRTQNASRSTATGRDYAVVTHRTVLETAGAFLSDKSGGKYHKPTSRTQDN